MRHGVFFTARNKRRRDSETEIKTTLKAKHFEKNVKTDRNRTKVYMYM